MFLSSLFYLAAVAKTRLAHPIRMKFHTAMPNILA
jgi:hypothetical protein